MKGILNSNGTKNAYEYYKIHKAIKKIGGSSIIENLKKENIKISILGVMLTLATIYNLIFDFESYAWIMIGFLAWCCFTYIRGNLRAIEYYKN